MLMSGFIILSKETVPPLNVSSLMMSLEMKIFMSVFSTDINLSYSILLQPY